MGKSGNMCTRYICQVFAILRYAMLFNLVAIASSLHHGNTKVSKKHKQRHTTSGSTIRNQHLPELRNKYVLCISH